MNLGVAAIACILILLVVVFVLWGNKKDRIQARELKKRLEDDQFIDHETGRKYSSEEDGFFDEAELERIKTDSEIEELYDASGWNLEKVKNELRKQGLKKIEVTQQDIDFLSTFHSFLDCPDLYFNCCYTRQSGGRIFLIYFDYGVNSGQTRNPEIQLLFWANLKGLEGHYYCTPPGIGNNLLSEMPQLNPPLIGGYLCYAFEDAKDDESLRNTFRVLRGTDFEIELKEQVLIIKSNRMISVSDAKKLCGISKILHD